MKKIIFIPAFLLLLITIKAQTFEIEYKKQMDVKAIMDSIDKNPMAKKFMSETDRKQMAEGIGEATNFTLLYSNGKSLYKAKEEAKKNDDDDDLNLGNKGGFKFRRFMNKMNSVFYKDFEKNQSIRQQPIFDKTFLIQDSIHALDWKISEETKKIGDYECKKATAQTELQGKKAKIEAWYTEEIPIPEGPENYFGLPGLILEAKIGPVTYYMTQFTILKEDKEILPPKEGEKITQQKFDKLMKEKMESMKNMQRQGRGPF